MQRKEWQGLGTTGIISGTNGTVTLKSIENTVRERRPRELQCQVILELRKQMETKHCKDDENKANKCRKQNSRAQVLLQGSHMYVAMRRAVP